MKLRALKDLNQTLKAGAIFELPKEKAMPLIEAGLITPEGRIAYRIYSNILDAFLWVTEDEAGADKLRAEGISEPVYTAHEIAELKKLSRGDLKAIHEVKEVFENSKIKEVTNAKQ